MKNPLKIVTIILSSILALTATTAVIGVVSSYTKDETDALVLQLQESIDKNKSDVQAQIDALTREYQEKEAELLLLIEENKNNLATLTSEYETKVAELEADDESIKQAIADLEAEYLAKVEEIENTIETANQTIANNKSALESAINLLQNTYEAKVAEIEAVISQLETADTNKATIIAGLTDRIVELEKGLNITNVTFAENGDLILTFADGTTQTIISSKQESVKFNYIVNQDGATCSIYGVSGRLVSDLIIPESLDGFTVTGIGDNAFNQCAWIKKVTIADTITTIGNRAFANCGGITAIEIPDSVTTIGKEAFNNCLSLTSVMIGKNLKAIYDKAFFDCNKLVEVINKSTHITVTKGATDNGYLGHYALGVCNATDIHASMISNDNGYIVYTDGAEKILVGYTGNETELVLPEHITQIYQYAFKDCTSITSVVVPYTITQIGNGAFAGCFALTKMTLPFAGATKNGSTDTHFGYIFGASSYSNNKNYVPTILKEITITGGVIKADSFDGCDSLNTIVIGNDVTTIGSSAFSGCSSLTEIVITDGVTSIAGYAFAGCSNLTEIEIPDSVTSIGDGAFSGCSSLQSITIPFIGAKAGKTAGSTYQYPFGYIFGTTSYTGSKGVTQYYYGYSASSTTSTTYYIPSSLRSVTVTGGNILYGAFYNCSSLTEIVIPDSVISIGEYAFYGCSSLTGIVIPDGVTSIGGYAFSGCSSLTSVEIPDSITTIGNSAFYNCYKLVEVVNKSSNVTITQGSSDYGNLGYYALNVHNGDDTYISKVVNDDEYIVYIDGSEKILVNYIGVKTDLILPTYITKINQYAFYQCDTITSVLIPDSVKSIGNYAFYSCDKLNSIVIPNNVKSIGSYAFYNCAGLKSAVIGDDVVTIGNYAFYECDSITSVVIGDSVSTIGSYAFYDCDLLTSVVISSNVITVNNYAFTYCYDLSIVYYKGSILDWTAIQFGASNTYLTNATRYYYSEQEPIAEGNYWHYDENGDIAVWGAQG